MKPIALLTCSQHPLLPLDERLWLAPLQTHGINAIPVVWNESTPDWSDFSAVLIRSTWDYYLQPEVFLRMLQDIEQVGVPLWNPLQVVQWNLTKDYLREIDAAGFPIMPTIWLSRQQPTDLKTLLAQHGWSQAVVKPTFSATAFQTLTVTPENMAEAEALLQTIWQRSDAMLQPFAQDLYTHGEWSLIWIGGQFSHAVQKFPAQGDFRVQEDFGGQSLVAKPNAIQLEMAQAVWQKFGQNCLFGRIDLMPWQNSWVIGELELIEPSLYLGHSPDAPQRLANAIALKRSNLWSSLK